MHHVNFTKVTQELLRHIDADGQKMTVGFLSGWLETQSGQVDDDTKFALLLLWSTDGHTVLNALCRRATLPCIELFVRALQAAVKKCPDSLKIPPPR